MVGNILHLCLPSLYTMIVRILDVIVTFIQQFATTNYNVTYLLSCHNWIIKLVRGPVGQTQTGPRTRVGLLGYCRKTFQGAVKLMVGGSKVNGRKSNLKTGNGW